MEACADLIYSTIIFVDNIVTYRNPESDITHLSWITCHLNVFVLDILSSYCIFLTLILSTDRLYAILKPLKIKLFFTHLYPKQTAAICFFALLAIKAPVFFVEQVEYKAKDENSENKEYANFINKIFYEQIHELINFILNKCI